MKKIFSFLTILICSMFFAGYTWATDYNLWIAGVQVTDANKDNITGTGISGKVSYNSTTSTLTLENATISSESNVRGIENDISYLKINLIGNNTITTDRHSVYSKANFSIIGSGSLVASSGNCGIFADKCNLTIEGVTVTAIGEWGIAGYNGSSEVLTIKNAIVKATGTKGSICDFKNIILEGCGITKPSGAVIDGGAVKLNGEKVKGEVVIEEPITYDLTVAGVKVTSVNASNITGECISGKVNYNAATNTLTLENAIIKATGSYYVYGISNNIENLKINLIGNNKIDVGQFSAIFSYKNISIVGSGSLEANSAQDNALYVQNGNLTIEGVTITATGDYWGIRGSFKREMLSIKNATVKATGRGGSICYFKEIKLEDCAIAKPSGAVIDNGSVKLNGNEVKGEVVIEPIIKYDLRIAGTQVTSINQADILGDSKVSYNPTTNTLTLENATISSNAAFVPVIQNEIDGLTIQLIGSNTISVLNIGIYSYDANLTITGSGSLNLTTQGSCIVALQSNLIINNTTIEVAGAYGISGGGENEILTIKNATVKATGTNGSICNFKNIILEGCAIAKPSGAVIDGGAVKLNGEVVTEEVVIEPIGAGVKETLADHVKIRMQNRQLTVENIAREAIAVYNVMGQVIATKQNPNNTETFILPAAGVYIVKVGKGSTKAIAL